MFDLHSHLLPAVDDGSRSAGQSAKVLAQFQREGVLGVCLTPHLLASRAPDGMPEAHVRAWDALRAVAPAGILLYRGAEVMLDRPLDGAVARDRAVTLNGSRYLLVEFPRLVAAQTVEQALGVVVGLGLVPVLAHPERYSSCTVAAVRRWKSLGALMQVDGPTLLSGRSRGERARQLLAHGLADIGAGDNHGDDRSLKPAWDALHEGEGGVQAQLLFRKNPESLLADAAPVPVPPFTFRLAFLERLKMLLGRGAPDRS